TPLFCLSFPTRRSSDLINIPKIAAPDGRGNLSVVEKDTLPYAIKRVYYLYDVPSNSTRGGHAHKELQQCLIALSGSFIVVVEDRSEEHTSELQSRFDLA